MVDDLLYPLLRLAGIGVAGFAVSFLLTRPLIGWLKSHNMGKTIRADGPDHAAKAGTPTMGGLGMLGAIGVVGLITAASGYVWTDSSAIRAALVTGVVFAAIGLIDDLAGIGRLGRRESGIGVSARWMFAVQIVAAIVIAQVFRPEWAFTGYALLAGLVVVGTATGVNFSDGLDGLAAGLLVAAYIGMALVLAVLTLTGERPVLRVGPALDHPSEAVMCAVAAGAAAGFLWFNRHPARVIMGNVASLSMGAMLGSIAMTTATWPLLVVLGAVFVAEVLSVVIQVGYFKATGGKRFFRMAPLHHHFEKVGWSEQKIVHRFWTAGATCAALAVALTLF